jgi:hypothetical protein
VSLPPPLEVRTLAAFFQQMNEKTAGQARPFSQFRTNENQRAATNMAGARIQIR